MFYPVFIAIECNISYCGKPGANNLHRFCDPKCLRKFYSQQSGNRDGMFVPYLYHIPAYFFQVNVWSLLSPVVSDEA